MSRYNAKVCCLIISRIEKNYANVDFKQIYSKSYASSVTKVMDSKYAGQGFFSSRRNLIAQILIE